MKRKKTITFEIIKNIFKDKINFRFKTKLSRKNKIFKLNVLSNKNKKKIN